MGRKLIALIILAGLLSVGVLAKDEGKKVENFTLEDCNGVKHSLTDYAKSKVIVLMFIATQCPVSNAYNQRMVDLYNDYSKKGVSFIGINSNKQESVEEIKNHAKEHGFEFPVLKDWNNVIAGE